MKALLTSLLVLSLGLPVGGTANADIYVWTDESGVKHITNYAPPEQARVLIRTPEIPYDAEADRQRREAERREQLAREKRELAEQRARIELLEREASARLAAAEQLQRQLRAYEKGREDQALEQETSTRSYWFGSPGWYGGWERYPGYGRNGYYRKDGNIYYKQPRPHHRYKPHKPTERVYRHPAGGPYDRSSGVRAPHPGPRQPLGGPHTYQRRY